MLDFFLIFPMYTEWGDIEWKISNDESPQNENLNFLDSLFLLAL